MVSPSEACDVMLLVNVCVKGKVEKLQMGPFCLLVGLGCRRPTPGHGLVRLRWEGDSVIFSSFCFQRVNVGSTFDFQK